MGSYLLALSLGPVQEFIASARRTRDLWSGSRVLSEVSKAAAKALHDAGASLIFPAPAHPELLEPDSELLVANHILALVDEDGGSSVQSLAGRARASVQERWLQFADAACDAAGRTAVNQQYWQEQIHDVIEFYAAWVPVSYPGTGTCRDMPDVAANHTYQAARRRVERLLAGRKALRDFSPAHGHAGVPKSSLDAARESVLTTAIEREAHLRLRLGVKTHEHLDAVGVVKRCTPSGEQQAAFVSVARVAVDPWVRKQLLTKKDRRKLAQIRALCHPHFSPRVASPVYQAFPFDGEVLMPSRLEVFAKDEDLKQHVSAIRRIQELLRDERGRYTDVPAPYFAILVADGDRMGAALDSLATPEEHKTLSQRLSTFASAAWQVVEEHQGCLVYSGGDDVLAFLPLDRCVSAARCLHRLFGRELAGVLPCGTQPTLSVGIGIGHCLEPLEDLLQLARTAGKAAKQGERLDGTDNRNGLAISLATRGGSVLSIRDQWTRRPDERLERWIGYLKRDLLPSRVAYEVYELAQLYNKWTNDGAVPRDLLIGDLRRALSRKQVRGQALTTEVTEALSEGLRNASDLDRLAGELLVARHLAAAYWEAPASRPEPGISAGKAGDGL